MPPLLLLLFFGLGVLVNLVSWAWTLILCGRQGVAWVLAVLFLPFANLVFLVKFWAEAKRPFFLSLAGFALILAPVMMNPQAFSKGLGNRFALPGKSARQTPLPSANAPAAAPGLSETFQREQASQAEAERRQRRAQETRAAYDKHRAEADALFKDLNTRRAKLKVDDARAVAIFNADAARYAALLEQARMEHDALEPVVPAAPAVDATSKVAPPAARSGPAYVPGVVGGNPVGTKPTSNPPNEAASLPRRALDKARTARDAASGAEDAGPFAGEVYGTAPPAPAKR